MWRKTILWDFLLWIAFLKMTISISLESSFSITKGGNIRIGNCNFSNELYFPGNDPQSWYSCDDATTYTWENDFDHEIGYVSSHNKLKLLKSMGFCPHRRCQLFNLSGTGPNNICPPGLCYTKIENGRPSFGACCFEQGAFHHGDLIGYYYKSQPSPKPIYRKNRIVLGKNPRDVSYHHFMNANEILPNLIATQCPLRGYPTGYADTLLDAHRMILENEIALWIQIAPYSTDGSFPLPPPTASSSSSSSSSSSKYCDLFPLDLFPDIQKNINITHERNERDHYYNLSYSLQGHSRQLINGTIETMLNSSLPQEEAASADWIKRIQQVEHLWFYRWDDFSIPESSYDDVINKITSRAVEYLSRNKTVVLSCFSGRGRSGTLATLIGAKAYKLKTISEVVDLIVQMRRNRDGLVETPQQLNYILRLLNRYSNLSLLDSEEAPLVGQSSFIHSIAVLAVCLLLGILSLLRS